MDQPPLSVALVWLARRLFGDSLYGLRLFPGWRSRRPSHSRAGYVFTFVFVQFGLPGWWAAPV